MKVDEYVGSFLIDLPNAPKTHMPNDAQVEEAAFMAELQSGFKKTDWHQRMEDSEERSS